MRTGNLPVCIKKSTMISADVFRRAVLGFFSPSGKRARLMVLTFHQVPLDPDPIAPGLPHSGVFAEQMRWLAAYCTVMPLLEAAQGLQENKLPARAACITFDDGYANNFDVAASILRECRLPAIFFVTAGAIEKGIMWNDLVIEGIRVGSHDLSLKDLGFGEYRLTDDTSRRTAINDIITKLKYKELAARWAIAESIYSQATGKSPPRLMMTTEQVAGLGTQGFDIGAHTMNHPILKELSPNDARHEIEASRIWVGDVTGSKPMAFAYPNGRPGIDFDTSHEKMACEAGFQVAVSTRWACAKRTDSLFALPRFTPWERDKHGFWLRLAKTAVRSYIGGGD